MLRPSVGDPTAFLAVARERRFTRAAARLGLRRLTRTTRSVSPTEVGERLLRNVGPR